MEERTPYYKDPVKQEEVTKKLFTRAQILMRPIIQADQPQVYNRVE
jgi:hypothetical protein